MKSRTIRVCGVVVALLAVMAIPAFAQNPHRSSDSIGVLTGDRVVPFEVADALSLNASSVSIPVIPADQVTTQIVRAFFERALYQVENGPDNSGIFLAKSVGGLYVYVAVNESGKSIEFLAQYRFKPSTSELQRLKLINDMNVRVRLPRFSMQGDRPHAIYAFPYDEGLSPRQMLVTAKDFEAGVSSMIDQFGNELVQ